MDNKAKKIRIKKKNDSLNNYDNEDIRTDKIILSDENDTNVSTLTPEEEENRKKEAEIFKSEFEQHLQEIESGKIITGKIVHIDNSDVYVDIFYKSEGRVPLTEFKEKPNIGDEIDVFVLSMENDEGDLEVSKQKADVIRLKQQINDSFYDGSPIEGKILKAVKSGYIVDIGVEAFLPQSQLDMYKVAKPEKHIGKTYQFRITKYEKGSGNNPPNVVLSRRVILEEEQQKAKELFYNTYKEGDYIMGTVKTIMDYGVFVDVGAIDGFVHISDLSWDHIKNPKQVVEVGQDLKAIILSIDIENNKINLGVKQLSEDPWEVFCKEHYVGDVVEGIVSSLTDFGAFVKVTNGVEGLIHTSELSWTKKNVNPRDVLKKASHLNAKILDIDRENRKLALGLKQVLPNPWDTIDERFPVGKVFTGKITSIIDSGIFVELEKNIDGFLSSNDVDWAKNQKNRETFKTKQSIEVIILNIDKENKKIALGRKQLIDNPYEVFIREHPMNSIVKGKVVKIEDYGAFVELSKEVVGLVHISNLAEKRVEKIDQIVKIGDEIGCVVVDIDLKKNKIGLSIKDYDRRLEQMDVEKYIESQDKQTATLGDLIDLDKLKGNE